MTSEIMKLFEKAEKTRLQAYAPYSKFLVGACIETVNGNYYAGCNVENAAYGLTNCAESSAISAMIAAGEREIRQVAVVVQGPGVSSPCGACRQRLSEFASAEVPVHLYDLKGAHVIKKMGELLPLAFGPGDLGVN